MKNKKWIKAALLLLPLLVVMVASAPTGVVAFDGEELSYFSWFQIVQQSPFGWCAPAAALLNYCVFAFAVVYCLLGKKWSIQGVFVGSFAAACIAALPIIAQSGIRLMPNVMGVIFLAVESLIAYVEKKRSLTGKEEKAVGKRLK